MLLKKLAVVSVLGAAALLLAGCERKANHAGHNHQTGPAANGAATTAAELPATLFVTDEPAEAVAISAAKRSAEVGDTVVVRGRIGGSRAPFVEGRAVFTLADTSMMACSDRSGDGCPTPWDYCCEPREDLVANTLTVQIVDDAGQPLRRSLQNVAGLKPLAEVVVQGRVLQKEGATVMVVGADALYVKGS
jgi:hypothetical protein